MNLVDSDGRSASAPIKAIKVLRKAYKSSKTAKRITTGTLLLNELYGYYDDYNTLSNNESSIAEKIFAGIDVLTGLGSEAKAVTRFLGFNSLLETNFRAFNYRNFRHNLGQLTGGIPDGVQAHHTLPQAFRKEFERIGINIDDPKYGAWLDITTHQKTKDPYNARWQQFFNQHNAEGTIPSVEDVEDFAKKLMYEFYNITM